MAEQVLAAGTSNGGREMGNVPPDTGTGLTSEEEEDLQSSLSGTERLEVSSCEEECRVSAEVVNTVHPYPNL